MDLADIPGQLNSSCKFKPNLDFLWSLRSQWLKKRTAPACLRQPHTTAAGGSGQPACPDQTASANLTPLGRRSRFKPSYATLPLHSSGLAGRAWGAPQGEEAGEQETELVLKGRAAGQSRLCVAQLAPQRRPSQVSVLMCSLQKPHRAKLDLSSFSSARSSPTAASTLPFNSGEANCVFGKLN